MENNESRICVECEGSMSPVILLDKTERWLEHRSATVLEYRLPEDRLSFWTGKYATAGVVKAFMCEECGRIALFGQKPDA